MFIDPDDWIETNLLEEMSRLIASRQSDLVGRLLMM